MFIAWQIDLVSPTLIENIAVTLLHFLWQGCLIGMSITVAVHLLRRNAPEIRYRASLAALVAMVVCPVSTFLVLSEGDQQYRSPARVSPATASPTKTPEVLASNDPYEPHDRHERLTDYRPAEVQEPASESTPGSRVLTAVAGDRNEQLAMNEDRFPTTGERVAQYSLQVMVGIYVLGVLAMLARLGMAVWGGRRLRRRCSPILNPELLARLSLSAERLGISCLPMLASCSKVATPVVVGIGKPWILVPASMLTTLSMDQIQLILMHELAHIYRRDLWVHFLQRICEAFLFFHPAVWYVNRLIARERENCCDELVVGRGGHSKVRYADALLAMAEVRQGCFIDRGPFTSVAADGGRAGQLRRRLFWLLGHDHYVPLSRTGWLVLLGCFAFFLAMPLVSPRLVQFMQVSAEEPTAREAVSTPEEMAVQQPSVDCSIRVNVLDVDGQPLKKMMVRCYREVTDDIQESDWRDSVTNKIWRPIDGFATGGTAKHESLSPGTYLVTVRQGHDYRGPYGRTEPIVLTIDSPHYDSNIRLTKASTLTIDAFDETTTDSITDASVSLNSLETSMPPDTMIRSQVEQGHAVFHDLPPGTYRLHLNRKARGPEDRNYSLANGEPIVTIEANVDQSLSFGLVGKPLSDEEKSARWPWLVHGRVTDADGHPVAGASIWASAGWGSLFSSIVATTDDDGRYAGRFSQSGMRMLSDEGDELNLVSGQVGAYKSGFAESNLNRQGGGYATNRMPREDETPEDFDPMKVYVQDVSREVNFVLMPAAQLSVQILNPDGRPLVDASLSIDGEELPPACSVIAADKTNQEGRVLFDSIPTGFDWWFSTDNASGAAALSPPVRFESGKYSLVLQLQDEPGSEGVSLKLVQALDAQGADVRDSLLVKVHTQGTAVPLSPALQLWVDKILLLKSHNPMAFQLGPSLLKLPEEDALAVVRAAWPQIEISYVKTGILKAFQSEGPEHVVQVLHLGMTDSDPYVMAYADTYLKTIAMRSFEGDLAGYEKWYARLGQLPLHNILETSFGELLRQLESEPPHAALERLENVQTYRWATRPSTSEALRVSGIPMLVVKWIQSGQLESKDLSYAARLLAVLPFDDGTIDTSIIPLMGEKNNALVRISAAKAAVGRVPDQARQTLLEQIEQIIRSADDDSSQVLTAACNAISETGDAIAIPYLIAIMDSDNSESTILNIGQALAVLIRKELPEIDPVQPNSFQDGQWWRQWFELHKSSFPELVRNQSIQELPKTEFGKTYKYRSTNLETHEGRIACLQLELQKVDGGLGGHKLWEVALSFANAGDPRAIPILIGAIDADNSYDTVYGLGYYGLGFGKLGELTKVKYSSFHDGAWWKRWWEANKSKFPQDVQTIPVPEYPKSKHGAKYQNFPDNLDSHEGRVQFAKERLLADRANMNLIAELFAEARDPRGIPFLIGVIVADASGAADYEVGYFGLRPLTNVSYDASHNAQWWREWWSAHRHEYPTVTEETVPEVSIAIPQRRDPLEDVADISAQDLLVEGDPHKRYFLIGDPGNVPADKQLKLLVVLPGGDGGVDFHPFVRRILKYALDDSWVIAQPVSVKWNVDQKIVWPTRKDVQPNSEFCTEEFIEAVIKDAQQRLGVESLPAYSLSWSSSGPAAYATAFQASKSVRGSYIAMSVFQSKWYPSATGAKGHRFVLDHSPDDDICPYQQSLEAEKWILEKGGVVMRQTYEGGHGWHGDVYGRIRSGMQWLIKTEEE